MATSFVDTNILVYAADETAPTPRKTEISRTLLEQPGLCLSVQVLNEFITNMRHPHKLGFSPVQEGEWLAEIERLPVSGMTLDTLHHAIAIHFKTGIAHWDALIIAAARDFGCEILYSEDFNHGQDYEGLKAVNPFL